MKTIEQLDQLLTLAAPYGMRIGNSIGRTLYTLDFTGEGNVIGMVDTVNQARLLTDAVNALPALLRVATAARARMVAACETVSVDERIAAHLELFNALLALDKETP
jgi:hypothetical protein